MSKAIGLSIARQKLHHIREYGSPIIVGSVATFAKRKPIALNSMTQHFSSRDGGGPIIDPAIYEVAALEFTTPPSLGSTLVWRGVPNSITRVDDPAIADIPTVYNLVACRALLAVDGTGNPLPPCEKVHRWTPKSLSQRTDPTNKSRLTDPGFTDVDKVVVYLEPLADNEKLMAGGTIDTRIVRVFSNVALRVKDVLIQADGTAWSIEGASEVFPATGDMRARATHLQIKPSDTSY